MKKNRKWLKIILPILSVIMLIAIIFGITIFSLTSPTKGNVISKYAEPKAALLVIDMQKDTTSNTDLYGNTTSFVNNVNKTIETAQRKNMEIVYIKQEYKANPITALISMGKYKHGTKGAELTDELQVVNKNIFTKNVSDAFSVKEFENYLITKQVNTIYIVGADATACVYKTALGGVNRKYNVQIIKDSIITVNSDAMEQMLKKYEADGISTVNLEQFN